MPDMLQLERSSSCQKRCGLQVLYEYTDDELRETLKAKSLKDSHF